jgi:hypothetical protein
MTASGFIMAIFASTGLFEPLCGTFSGFHFRHRSFPSFIN